MVILETCPILFCSPSQGSDWPGTPTNHHCGSLCCWPEWGHLKSLPPIQIRVAFRSLRSLQSMLTRPDLHSKVIYKIPCSCGKANIGETTRRLETRLKEHKDACIKQVTDKSAIVEHVWSSHCPIKGKPLCWDHARNSHDLMIKEAIHIQTTPLQGQGCWDFWLLGCYYQCPCTETALNNCMNSWFVSARCEIVSLWCLWCHSLPHRI